MRENLPVPDSPDILTTIVPHGASIGALLAAMMGWLPVIVAVIPAIYYLILIWESSTVQHYIRNARMRRKSKRIARLKAKAKLVQAQLDAEEVVRVARAEAKEKVKAAAHEAAKLVVTETLKTEEKLPPV